MRLYRRKNFLKLPSGIIFSCGYPFIFKGFSVKGESFKNDYESIQLEWVEGDDDVEQFNKLSKMLYEESSYEMENDFVREGDFNEEIVFLVFEPKDLKKIIKYWEYAINLNI